MQVPRLKSASGGPWRGRDRQQAPTALQRPLRVQAAWLAVRRLDLRASGAFCHELTCLAGCVSSKQGGTSGPWVADGGLGAGRHFTRTQGSKGLGYKGERHPRPGPTSQGHARRATSASEREDDGRKG